jgi:hypothetical protein
MALPTVIAMSLTLCWMLSPDVLVRLGSGIAENRTLFLAALAVSSLVSALAVSIIRHPELRHHGKCSQTGLLTQGVGRITAMSMILASRLCLVLLIPTGLLVTAGFAFNEIFVYWFPNFGFAFILLGIISIIQLAGIRFASMAQPVFALIVLASLFILSLAGLGGAGSSNPVSVDIGISFTPPVITGAILLFLGFDYITPEEGNDSRLPAFGALFFCLLIFLFWSMLSLQYVGAERLSQSSIPYMLTAREILGEPGRYIMGIAVISGVCGAVNGLYLLALGSLNELSHRHMLPGHPPGRLKRKRFVLLFSTIIGVFLMGGLAGDIIIETYIQASLLLWVLLIGLQCISAGRILRQLDNPKAWQGSCLGIFYILCALYLILAHHQAAELLRFLLSTIAATAGASLIWLWKKPAYEVTHPNSEKTGGKS